MSTKRNHALVYRRVPAFLRAMRKEAGLTQRELADRIKQDQWWVARSETGSRRLDVAEFIEFAIGCGKNPTEAMNELVKLRR